jgi:Uri superfamily endonuclease
MGTPGSYSLLMELPAPRTLTVGRLGSFRFPAGWYVYAGSALGGVEQRVARHLRPSHVRRWHLDYVKAEATIRQSHAFPGRERCECDLAAELLSRSGAAVPAPRFGASDCRCPSHLIYFKIRPALP